MTNHATNAAERKKLHDRMMRKIVINAATGCWEWQGATTGKDGTGYGMVSTNLYSTRLAHRIMYEYVTQQELGDNLACHKCDNRRCCNPDHIFPGTFRDNQLDAMEKGRDIPPPRMPGESHPSHRLTEETVREIRRLHALGLGKVAIGKQLGLKPGTVSNIIHKQRWKHVT